MSFLLRKFVNNLKNKSFQLNKIVTKPKNNVNLVKCISTVKIDVWKLDRKFNNCLTVNHGIAMGVQQQVRYKYNQKKGTKGGKSQDDEDGEENDDLELAKDPNLIRVHVNSLRSDLILKAGLGLARNKVEAIFYESKIRVNGEKIFKKSLKLNVGDEIDIIKGLSVNNPDHLVVARVEIVDAIPKEENILVKLRRNKTLIIENYPSENSWKPADNPANN